MRAPLDREKAAAAARARVDDPPAEPVPARDDAVADREQTGEPDRDVRDHRKRD